MSRLKRTVAANKVPKLRRRLERGLSRVDREAFLQLMWSVWGLQQSEPVAQARRLIRYPQEALGAGLGSKWAIHPWELETLFNLLIRVAPDRSRPALAVQDFSVASDLVNALRNLENVESGAYLDRDLIFSEMHRVGQRQFPWQRDGVNRAELYRNLFLYGQGTCGAFFETHHGVSVEDFTKTGLVLYVSCSQNPLAGDALSTGVLGLERAAAERAAAMMTVSLADAGSALTGIDQSLGAAGLPTAFQPSLLRRAPILDLGGGRLHAPLPPLILQRMTAGLYYDLLPGGGRIRAEIGRNFEIYCQRLLTAAWPQLTVGPEHRYARRGPGDQVDSPDLLIADSQGLVLVIECKSTKLTFSAQFAEDPVSAAAQKYDELAKGVFQLWRFFAHCRLGLSGDTLTPDTQGLVVTVDVWLMLSRSMQDRVMSLARAKAAADPDITPVDQRTIAFVSVQDLERVLLRADAAGFLRTVRTAATDEQFSGWMLPDVRRELGETAEDRVAYPFEIGEILPWWNQFEGPHDAG
ncbi:hypothetical protein [Caulobacter sp. RHG1]|uniref:hypothetical protein n=1 Tax=Caulobacter sp. (strain RHG1) TaxID=2545762 RepID=UPI00155678C8|nr:hypothetical protein [Caulobacter sp. RHG1]NQE61518.1 hypothetical protein [Caulobacter sp. RHG1]